MSRRSAVIVTRPGDSLGFRLAGVRTEEVQPGEEEARVGALLESPTVGVLAVEDQVLRHVPEALLDRAAKVGLPVVFPFALPRRLGEPGYAESYVGLLIRRAIGFHVRLK